MNTVHDQTARSVSVIITSDNLIPVLRDYLKRTNTPPTVLGRLIFKDPGIIKHILNGSRLLKPTNIQKLEHYIRDNPEGNPSKRTPRLLNYVTNNDGDVTYQTPYLSGNIPSYDPCIYCGIRGELGCKHRIPFHPQPVLSTI